MNDADVALEFAAPQQPTITAANDDVAAAIASSNMANAAANAIMLAAAGGVDASVDPNANVEHKGRLAEPEAQIFSETVRRLSRSRGGVFEMLSLLPGQTPGEPARSIEGWVLIITGLPPECTEGDILDYFGRRAEPKNCRLNYDRRTSMCVGHAFVEYNTREEAQLVIADMNGQPFLSANAIAVAPAFLVPELIAFEQLGRNTKRGRARDDRIGADEVEGDDAGNALDERGGVRAE